MSKVSLPRGFPIPDQVKDKSRENDAQLLVVVISLFSIRAGSVKLDPDSPHKSGDRGAGVQRDVVNWISMIFERKYTMIIAMKAFDNNLPLVLGAEFDC